MTDDKTQTDARDRERVSGLEDYEVAYFAKANGISPQTTRELIKRFGNDRATLEREAARMAGN